MYTGVYWDIQGYTGAPDGTQKYTEPYRDIRYARVCTSGYLEGHGKRGVYSFEILVRGYDMRMLDHGCTSWCKENGDSSSME